MKESVGLTVTINIVVVFLAVSFVLIIGIVTYNRAYKAASLIVKEIEKYEGYNDLSFSKINENLTAIGYVGGDSSKCKATRKASGLEGQLVEMGDEKYKYCIYWFDYDESNADKKYNKHYSYGVVTYMTFDFNMFGIKLQLPIYAKTTRIYRFTNT